jgi:pimeloyl-ACP methyl ester carboxylesterase
MQRVLPLIRFGIATVPEPEVMKLTFLGGSMLGLPTDKAAVLHNQLSSRYVQIAEDKTFASAPSALGYCFSATKPASGFGTVYVPETPTADSKVILFLHGYGGSFIYYLHYLAGEFPDHIIICPAFGVSCGNVSSEYLQECLDAVSQEIKVPLAMPTLIGLSAGGFGGFREYTRRPNSYLGYICLAAYPPPDIIADSPTEGRIRLIAGGTEGFVRSGVLRRSEQMLMRRTPDYASHQIPHHDHFFLLTAEDETKKHLQNWVNELEAMGQ